MDEIMVHYFCLKRIMSIDYAPMSQSDSESLWEAFVQQSLQLNGHIQ